MTALLHFEEKVHRKDLARAEVFPLLMPRLLSQVLEHLGFLKEPRIERRVSCLQVLSIEWSLYMLLSILLQPQEEAADDIAEDLTRGEQPVPKVEVERTSVPDSSPPVPPPAAPAPPEIAGPSSTSQQSPEHIPISSRELSIVMDAVCVLATTQASLAKRMARAEVTLGHNHAMLLRIMIHLDLPPASLTEPTQPTTRDQSTVSVSVASLDILAAATAASDPPASTPPRE